MEFRSIRIWLSLSTESSVEYDIDLIYMSCRKSTTFQWTFSLPVVMARSTSKTHCISFHVVRRVSIILSRVIHSDHSNSKLSIADLISRSRMQPNRKITIGIAITSNIEVTTHYDIEGYIIRTDLVIRGCKLKVKWERLIIGAILHIQEIILTPFFRSWQISRRERERVIWHSFATLRICFGYYTELLLPFIIQIHITRERLIYHVGSIIYRTGRITTLQIEIRTERQQIT